MPARGELVGDAYIRIFADSSPMRRALNRQMKAAATGAADEFLEKFDKTLRDESDKQLQGSREALVRAIVGGDFDRLLKRSGKSVEQFTKDVADHIDQMNKEAATSLRKQGRGVKKVEAAFDDAREALEHWADKAKVREFNEELNRSHVEALRLNKDFDRMSAQLERTRRRALDLTRGLDADSMSRFAAKINDAFSTRNIQRVEMLGRAAKRFGDAQRRVAKDIDRSHTEALRLNHAYDEMSDRLKGLSDHALKRLGRSISDVFSSGTMDSVRDFNREIRNTVKETEVLDEKAKKVHRRFTLFRRSLDGTSDSMAGMSHRGGILADTLTAPLRVALGLGKATQFATGWMEDLGESIGGIKGGIIASLPGLLSLVAAIGAIVAILPAFLSALSLAVGAVTALASAITYGLIGALLPLGPMLLAVAGGIGAIATAISGMNKAQKNAFAPIKDWFEDVRGVVADHLFRDLADQVETFGGTLRRFVGPLLIRSADALRESANRFLDGLDSPRMRKILDTYGQTLPRILGNLGDAFGDLVQGLLGFFEPILYYAERFSDNLAGLAERFKDWATSAEGRNSIAHFMHDAWESAQTLWDIIKQLARGIGGLFESGRRDGQGMLETIDRLVTRFADWANSKQGRDDLTRWFRDARDFAGDLKDIIGDLADAFDDLDTESSRKDLEDFLQTLGDISRWISNHTDEISAFSSMLRTAFKFVFPATGAIDNVKRFIDFIQNFNWVGLGLDIIQGLKQGIKTAATNIVELFRGLIIIPFKVLFGIGSPSKVFAGFGRDIVQGLINGIRDLATGLWGRVSGGFQTFISQVRDWGGRVADAGVSRIRALPGRITGALRGLAGSVSAPFRAATKRAGALAQTLVQRSTTFLSRLPGRARAVISSLPGRVSGVFSSAAKRASSLAGSLVSRASGVLSRLPGRARGAINGIVGTVSGVFQRAVGAVAREANRIVGTAASRLRGLPSAAGRAVAGVASAILSPFRTALGAVGGIISRIIGAAQSAASQVGGILSNIPHPRFASGGIVYGATTAVVGEAGPEAVVPLSRPLSQVDPAVRALSAIAQGKANRGSDSSGGTHYHYEFAAGSVVVQTPARDGRVVAEQVVDRILTGLPA